ncbi:Interleukin-21 receptor [Varanus komodoensis]|nr:Interleukin-21 receptor [Varanus komodoensis]
MQQPTEESKEAGPCKEAGPSQAALCTAGTRGSWPSKRRRMEHQVLLLLLFLPHTSACDDLACFADYIQTLMCMWSSRDTKVHYNLTASWNCVFDGTCYFLPTSGNATQTLYTCFSEQKLRFGSDNFVVEVTKFADEPLSTSKACQRTFTLQESSKSEGEPGTRARPASSFKPHPPFNLTTSASPAGYNISWKTHYQHFPYNYLNGQLQYQLRYRDRGRPRQEWSQKHILQDTRTLRLLRQELAGSTEYEFQVRAKPGQSSPYSGAWSEWSPPATMETLPRGQSLPTLGLFQPRSVPHAGLSQGRGAVPCEPKPPSAGLVHLVTSRH